MLGAEFRDRTVVISTVSLDSRQAVARFSLPDGASPECARFSGDGTRVAIGDDRGRVLVWNVRTKLLIATIDIGKRDRPGRIALSDDGKLVAAPAINGINDPLGRRLLSPDRHHSR